MPCHEYWIGKDSRDRPVPRLGNSYALDSKPRQIGPTGHVRWGTTMLLMMIMTLPQDMTGNLAPFVQDELPSKTRSLGRQCVRSMSGQVGPPPSAMPNQAVPDDDELCWVRVCSFKT